jgi:hypothetical protein
VNSLRVANRGGPGMIPEWRGIVTRNGRKFVCAPHAVLSCFNLNDDPYAEIDLAHRWEACHEHHRLQELLADWIERTGDSFALPALEPRPASCTPGFMHNPG